MSTLLVALEALAAMGVAGLALILVLAWLADRDERRLQGPRTLTDLRRLK